MRHTRALLVRGAITVAVTCQDGSVRSTGFDSTYQLRDASAVDAASPSSASTANAPITSSAPAPIWKSYATCADG